MHTWMAQRAAWLDTPAAWGGTVTTTPTPTPTATPTPTPTPTAGGSCTATLAAGTKFGDRFNVGVTVTGTSTWVVSLGLGGGQTVQSSWNGVLTATSGTVTARPNGMGNSFGLTIMASGNWTMPTAFCRVG